MGDIKVRLVSVYGVWRTPLSSFTNPLTFHYTTTSPKSLLHKDLGAERTPAGRKPLRGKHLGAKEIMCFPLVYPCGSVIMDTWKTTPTTTPPLPFSGLAPAETRPRLPSTSLERISMCAMPVTKRRWILSSIRPRIGTATRIWTTK